MDQPPRFSHHLRYGNILHPPNFIPHNLPPPPPPPHILFPPPHSLPPPRHDAHLPVPSRFSFSPTHHPILERSHVYEFNPPRKPYFDRCLPPPLQPRENLPFRFIHDYPEPNLIFEDESLRRRCDDSFFHDLPHDRDQNLHWVAREVNSRVSDIEHSGRYRKFSDLEAREFYGERNDDARRRDYGVNQGRELYIERYDDEIRCDYGFNNGGSSLQFEDRRPVFVESNFGLGRFSGRLVREGGEGEFFRSKKMRTVQKKSARRRHSRGSSILKKLNSGCFEGKEKEGFECLGTRIREKRAREQSPLELSISFKSNSLVAKAIMVPTSPAVKADMVLTPKKRNIRKIYSSDDSSLAKSGKDIVVTEHRLDFQSGLLASQTELPEKLTVSGNVSVTANNANDLGDNGMENSSLKDNNSQSSNNVGSGTRLVHRLKIKRRDRKQLIRGTSLQMTKDNGEIVNSDTCINCPSDVPQLNSNSKLSNVNMSCAVIDMVPDVVLLPSLGSIVSEKVDIDGDSSKPFVSKSKRKRSSLNTLSASLHVADEVPTDCPCYSGRVVSTTDDADCAGKMVTDKVTIHTDGSFLANENTCHGDCLEFSQHADNLDACVHNLASVLNSEKYRFESDDLFIRLDTDKVDRISEQPFQNGPVLLEKAFFKGPFKDPISVEGEDIAGLSRPKEVRISEVHKKDEHFSEYHTASDSDGASLKMIEHVSVSDMGSADANSKERFPNEVIRVCGPSNAEEIRILDDATVADCSSVNLGPATSSNFLSVYHKGIVAESDSSCGNILIEQSCDNGVNLPNKISSVEKSQEAINHVKTFFSTDYSSKTKRKRKTRGAQLGITGSNINVIADAVSSRDGELASLLPKDLSSAEEVDFPGEKDNSEEGCRLNERPSEDADSPQDGVDFFADGSFPCYRKKKKVVSTRLTLSFLLADYSIGDVLASDCLKLDQLSPRLPESGTDPREDTPPAASTATNKSDTTFMEGTDAMENLSIRDMVDALADGNRMHMKDDLSLIPNTSICADGNGVCTTKSGDELITTGFDMPPCISSPEGLVSYSDLSFSKDTKTSPGHSENEMIFGSLKTSNIKLLSGESKTFSLRKSKENATSKYKQTNDEVSPSLPHDGSKLVRELSFISGNLPSSKNQLTSTVPKVFPSHHALYTSRKFPPAHVTKSRTWHRTGNSSVAGPKLMSCYLPHSPATKATRNSESSYIRKGNSLVRKPSSSGVTPSKFHTSSSSDYQLSSCVDNLKKSQAFNTKIDAINAPSILSLGQVNTYERPEALSLNHIGKSSNRESNYTEESFPVANPIRNDCPAKTLDALEETVESSAISECQAGSGNNSDSQCTLDTGKRGKKITYVKCKSNQLVAASGYEDPSKTGVYAQVPLSDGYYKKRKNQLIRSSLENHVKKADAMVNLNSLSLGTRTKFSRTSGKRQSSKGFAKTHRAFPFVWKLHDAQLSDKHSNSIGYQKVWPYLFPRKKATCRRSFIHALGSKPNNSSLSTISQKLLLSSKRGAIYTRSTHGYSLRISKVLSVGGSSLKWSKSIERNSKKANEEATQAVAAAERRKKEEKGAIPIVLKTRNHVSRKSVLSVKLRPGERIFRVGSERYKMDPTRRTLHRITVEEPSTSVARQTEKNYKRSFVPRRLLIDNDEYVRIGNGNQLVRDPKKRTRILASEKVRWSLRTARLRLVRKRKYCQFFTRFGKCNKSDGKCPYIHDPSKIVVCTKFLNGSCTDPDCKLTHKVIPERMQDCSYFLKGSCSNENCPYRHVNVNPDSSICEGFLRGYCAEGNECRKKHTYVCPAFEETGICPQASSCKLHHPKKKTERKPTSEQKNVRGRYFDGGFIDVADCCTATTERLSAQGKVEIDSVEGKFPDYIGLDLSDEEMEN